MAGVRRPHFVLFHERSGGKGGRGSWGTSWIGRQADAFSERAEEPGSGCALSFGKHSLDGTGGDAKGTVSR